MSEIGGSVKMRMCFKRIIPLCVCGMGRLLKEMTRSSGKEEASALGASMEEGSSLSPLELLDRLITQGYQAHQNLRSLFHMPNTTQPPHHKTGLILHLTYYAIMY